MTKFVKLREICKIYINKKKHKQYYHCQLCRNWIYEANKIVDDNKTGFLYEVKIHTPGTPLSFNISQILTPVYQPSKTINQIILPHTHQTDIISTDS